MFELMKAEQSQHKHNHHIPPRFYLKGFVETPGSPFIWVYERGRGFNPGRVRHKYNPYRDSVKFVGTVRDYYAYVDEDGVMDSDTYENKLEQLEKPANPVLDKLRQHRMITVGEKSILASYMVLMLKRVPRRKEKANEIWPGLLESATSNIVDQLDSHEANTTDVNRLANISRMRGEIDNIREKYKAGIPAEILLNTMLSDSQLKQVLLDMTWQFFVAPKGMAFLTSDNPVFYFESFGLNKEYSEVTFPISSDVVLAASRHEENREGFFPANPATVKEVNRRTASAATREVYYLRASRWVVDVLNKKHPLFNLLYAYTGKIA